MSATTQELATIGAVFAILVGVMLLNALSPSRRRPIVEAVPAASAASAWLGRYVQCEGDVVGQVVAVEPASVVVRKGGAFLALPRAQVREQGLDLGVTPYDAAEAAAQGNAWKAEHPEA